METATVVSAYFPIKSKFPPEVYLGWIRNFMENIPCHLVFFTHPDLIPLFQAWRGSLNETTVFIPFDLSKDSTAVKKYGHSFWEEQWKLDKEVALDDPTRKIHSPELYEVWYEKKEFVLRAITMNPFHTDKYLWADAGGFRITEWFPHLTGFGTTTRISDSRFFLLGIQPFTEEEKRTKFILPFQKEARIGGGYLAAHKNVWVAFSKRYDTLLEEYAKDNIFVGKDQNLFATLYLRDPDFFDLVPTDHRSIDPWFWPQLYFSGSSGSLDHNNNNPISVMIPLYNGIEFLETSLTSVFLQTYTNWQVYIIINGHPPNSPVYEYAMQIVQLTEARFPQQTSKTTVIQLPSHIKGKPAAINATITQYIKTPWVSILDVDDYWFSEKLAEQVKYTLNNNNDVIGTRAQYFGNFNGQPHIPVGDISDFDFFSVCPIINSSVLLRTSLLQYDESETTGVEDYDLWMRLRYLTKPPIRFYNIPQVLVGHRIHKESAFNNANAKDVPRVIAKIKALQQQSSQSQSTQ